jgi:hypothetical protein|nr:MAG TPA: regulatory protein [Caudoviricetes sp.]
MNNLIKVGEKEYMTSKEIAEVTGKERLNEKGVNTIPTLTTGGTKH